MQKLKKEMSSSVQFYASNFGLVEFTRHPNINLSEPSFMSKQRNWTRSCNASQCLKITIKVAFKIASEASDVLIFRDEN